MAVPISGTCTEHRRQRARSESAALPQSREVIMHSKVLAIASALVVMLAGTVAWAQNSTTQKTPGHIIQKKPPAKKTRPGASQYTPRHPKRTMHPRHTPP